MTKEITGTTANAALILENMLLSKVPSELPKNTRINKQDTI